MRWLLLSRVEQRLKLFPSKSTVIQKDRLEKIGTLVDKRSLPDVLCLIDVRVAFS